MINPWTGGFGGAIYSNIGSFSNVQDYEEPLNMVDSQEIERDGPGDEREKADHYDRTEYNQYQHHRKAPKVKKTTSELDFSQYTHLSKSDVSSF